VNYQILAPAKQELINSIEYYNRKEINLGYKLLLDYEDAVDRILDNPMAWPPLTENTRRCLLKNFPYGIIYQTKDLISIIAFMNPKRKPDYWKEIVKKEGFEI